MIGASGGNRDAPTSVRLFGALRGRGGPRGGARRAQQQPGASGLPAFRRALDALLARFAETYNHKDVAGLAALFAEDAVLVPPGPIVAGRRDITQTYRTRLEHGAAGLRFEVVEARAEGGDLAWAVGRFTGTGPGEGGRQEPGATSPPSTGGTAARGC